MGLIILVVIVLFLLVSLKQIWEYQRGVLYTFGKFSRLLNPGWRIVIPVIQHMAKVDLRTYAVDVPQQESLTKDNIPVSVNAVLYFKVVDAAMAINKVQNYYYATNQLAQTTMRNAIGEVTLDKLLSNREEVSMGIKENIAQMTSGWGILVENVELKDIALPENMKRTIAKEAEAERERRAVIIKAEGEVMAAGNMAKAAKMLASEEGALHLRTLQSINDISSDESNTTIWMVPLEVLRAVEGLAKRK